jgi:hypothetical protein
MRDYYIIENFKKLAVPFSQTFFATVNVPWTEFDIFGIIL